MGEIETKISLSYYICLYVGDKNIDGWKNEESVDQRGDR